MEDYNFYKLFLDTLKSENPELILNPKWDALVTNAFINLQKIELDMFRMETRYNSDEGQ